MNGEFDVLVVGAGPAGATAAYELAQAGVRVLLLEKESLSRYKPCAGGLTAKTIHEIPFDLSPVIEDVCYDVAVSFRLGEVFRRHYYQPLAWMVRRDRFDYYLAERAMAAGATLLDQSPVTGVKLGPSNVEVHTKGDSFQAAALVGADGANSIVSRSLGMGGDFRYEVAWRHSAFWLLSCPSPGRRAAAVLSLQLW